MLFKTTLFACTRWEDNIVTDIRVIRLLGVDLIHLAENICHWGNLVNTEMNIQIPYKAGGIFRLA